jgi:hypothetical protein
MLTNKEKENLIRVGECAQPLVKPMPAGAIGDVNSDAKGSGARFNAGKPSYDLVPLQMVADYLIHVAGWHAASGDVIRALETLGRFQSRRGEDHDNLLNCLRELGPGGWDECARVFEYGRAKYAAWNWAKGMNWSIPIACAARHLLAMHRGEVIDPESGLPHRGHVFCNIVMLYTFGGTYIEGDDRPAKGLL